MKLLLDTHVFFWWLTARSRLSRPTLDALSRIDSEIYVSVVSAWEMAIKVGAGKWPAAVPILQTFEDHVSIEQFRLLPITVPHVRAAGLMASPHRDPFDRLLAAQAQIEGLTLVTADARVQTLGVTWLW